LGENKESLNSLGGFRGGCALSKEGNDKLHDSKLYDLLLVIRQPKWLFVAALGVLVLTLRSTYYLLAQGLDFNSVRTIVLGTITPLAIGIVVYWMSHQTVLEDRALVKKREEIETKSDDQSTPKLAWDLARITLEQYFNRNLGQTRLMFYLALIVMFAGFGLVVWTIMYSIANAQSGPKALIGVGAGVITQFIGATFMVLYRSTIQQASSYVEILERINAVGMAVQIIQDVPKDDPLHNKTRAEIAYLLLRGSHKIHGDQGSHETHNDRPVRPRPKRKTAPSEDA
jgi:hypothetical protein